MALRQFGSPTEPLPLLFKELLTPAHWARRDERHNRSLLDASDIAARELRQVHRSRLEQAFRHVSPKASKEPLRIARRLLRLPGKSELQRFCCRFCDNECGGAFLKMNSGTTTAHRVGP